MNEEELNRAIRDRYTEEHARPALAMRLIQDAKAQPKSRIIPMMIAASAIAAAALFFFPGGVAETQVPQPASEIAAQTMAVKVQFWRLEDEQKGALPHHEVYDKHGTFVRVSEDFRAPESATLVAAPSIVTPYGDPAEFTVESTEQAMSIVLTPTLVGRELKVVTDLTLKWQTPGKTPIQIVVKPAAITFPDQHGTAAMFITVYNPGNPDESTPYLLTLAL